MKKLTHITVAIPHELAEEMNQFPEVAWSHVARTGIKQYIDNRKNMMKAVCENKDKE